MEDLVRGLRNLGLRAPSPAQLLEILDDDAEVRQRLVRVLAFSAFGSGDGGGLQGGKDDDSGDGGGSSAAAALMGQDLLQEAVAALVDNFTGVIERQRVVSQRESAILRLASTADDGGRSSDSGHVVQGSSSKLGSNGKATRAATKKIPADAPKKVRLPPRKALLARQEAALRRAKDDEAQRHRYRPRLVFDGETTYVSPRRLSEMRRISCSHLDAAPRRYKGFVLVCRVLTPLIPYVGVTFLAEDQEGMALPVSISHFMGNLNMSLDNASAALPVGTVIAIKEPLLSLDHQARAGPCTGRSDVGIRVDSPTDVVVLDAGGDPGQPADAASLLDGLSWREPLPSYGDGGSSDGDDAYPHWLGYKHLFGDTKPSKEIAVVRRLLTEGRPGAAWRVLQKADSADEVRRTFEARILYEMRAWKEAATAFGRIADADNASTQPYEPHNKAADFAVPLDDLSAAEAAQRCALRQAQEIQGLTHGDVRSIYFASSERPRLDTADFIGPLAVREVSGAGRGLVTTRTVEPGELLLSCRAIGSAYPDDDESKGAPLVRLNVDNGVISSTTQVRAQTNLIHAIVDRPELALPVLGLTAGPGRPYSQEVKKQYPLRAKPILSPASALKSRPDVDAAYVDGVLRFNAFGPAQSPARSKAQDTDAAEEPGSELSKSTMPHPLPAILNHACLPNVASIFFSDIVTTRAIAVLAPGTEIVHQYVRGEEPYAIRESQLSKHGFECACALCIADRADGKDQCTQRARIIQGEARAIYERSRVLMKRINAAAVGCVADKARTSQSEQQQPFPGCVGALQSEEDREAHRDVLGALRSLVARINGTYAASRGPMRPEILPVQVVAVRHVALVEGVDAAVQVSSARDVMDDALLFLFCFYNVVFDRHTHSLYSSPP